LGWQAGPDRGLRIGAVASDCQIFPLQTELDGLHGPLAASVGLDESGDDPATLPRHAVAPENAFARLRYRASGSVPWPEAAIA